MQYYSKLIIAGLAAGTLNGWLGGGGGLILVPLLTGWIGLDTKKAFATSVMTMLPVSIVSAVMFPKNDFSFSSALPYLVGGISGGILSGRLFKKASPKLLKKTFGILMAAAGIWRLVR